MATRKEKSERGSYSYRLKKQDLRRWNYAQTLIAERLGIRDNLNALLALGLVFATIADQKHRPARYAEVRVMLEQRM